ncbi:MAG: hypothetical protein ACE5JG_12220, partial [Planctomycetota bacterium]
MLGRAALCLTLAGGCALPARAAEARPEHGYFRRHLWHWVVTFGTSLADNEYEDRVGPSSDPLLFSDPPGIDTTVRDRVARRNFRKGFLLENRSYVALGLGVGAAVAANLGRDRALGWMADDATGLVEVWFFDKGASGLVKNIVGRQ